MALPDPGNGNDILSHCLWPFLAVEDPYVCACSTTHVPFTNMQVERWERA
jgi:hypothetical protein